MRVKCAMRDLTTHLHLLPRLRMTGAVPPPPLYFHGVHGDNFILYTFSFVSLRLRHLRFSQRHYLGFYYSGM